MVQNSGKRYRVFRNNGKPQPTLGFSLVAVIVAVRNIQQQVQLFAVMRRDGKQLPHH